MIVLEGLAALLVAVGVAFFIAGTVGLLRFPDLFSRLHALVKADNLGMGFIAAGLALLAEDAGTVLVIVAVWVLALLASVMVSHLVAHAAVREGMQPWRKKR